jgi:hypothetical protein
VEHPFGNDINNSMNIGSLHQPPGLAPFPDALYSNRSRGSATSVASTGMTAITTITGVTAISGFSGGSNAVPARRSTYYGLEDDSIWGIFVKMVVLGWPNVVGFLLVRRQFEIRECVVNEN